ncbi:MAG: hypothetical protein RLZZ244_569 [Verrucomicrobiota bacterium]|jgi:hypothetical protein
MNSQQPPRSAVQLLALLRTLGNQRRHALIAMTMLAAGMWLLVLLCATFSADWAWEWSAPWQRAAVLALFVALLLGPTPALLRRAWGLRSVRAEAVAEEHRQPRYQERLSVVAEFFSEERGALHSGTSEELARKVAEEAHLLHEHFPPPVPPCRGRLRLVTLGFCAALGGSLFWFAQFGDGLPSLLQRLLMPWTDRSLTTLTLQPPPTHAAKNQSVAISAKLSGKVPQEAALLVRTPDGALQRVPLKVANRRVEYDLGPLTGAVGFELQAGRASSGWIEIQVWDPPGVSDVRIRVEPPQDSLASEQRLERWPRSLDLEAGSRIRVDFSANQPLERARALWQGDAEIPPQELQPDPAGRYHFDWVAIRNHSLALELRNLAGLPNATTEMEVRIRPPKPPQFEMTLPLADARFTPIEEAEFQATLRNAPNVLRAGLSLRLGDRPAREVVLSGSVSATGALPIFHVERLDSRGMQPGESLAWFFWAERALANGKVERMESPLQLGSIRPFEERYVRASGCDRAGDSEKLVASLRQLLEATWSVRKRIQGTAPGEALAEPVRKELDGLLQFAGTLLEKARSDAERKSNRDPRDAALHQEAIGHLERAIESLARTAQDPTQIQPSIDHEVSALNALSKILPDAFGVCSSSSASKPKDTVRPRQLDALEIEKAPSNYQTRRPVETEAERLHRSALEAALAEIQSLMQRQREVSARMDPLAKSEEGGTSPHASKDPSGRELQSLVEEQRAIRKALDSQQARTRQGATQASTEGDKSQTLESEKSDGERDGKRGASNRGREPAQSDGQARSERPESDGDAAGKPGEPRAGSAAQVGVGNPSESRGGEGKAGSSQEPGLAEARELASRNSEALRTATEAIRRSLAKALADSARNLQSNASQLGEDLAQAPSESKEALAEAGLQTLQGQVRELAERAEWVNPSFASALRHMYARSTRAPQTTPSGQGAGNAKETILSELQQQLRDAVQDWIASSDEGLVKPVSDPLSAGTPWKGEPPRDWNTVSSELRNTLLQQRGGGVPRRYTAAVQDYFRTIAEEAIPEKGRPAPRGAGAPPR